MEAHQRKDMVEPQAKTPSTAPDLTSIMVSSSSKQSVSPTGSQTKSIMNASGTSGAVVNNTPEPGLKRIPTVTFSDPKFASSITGKAVTPNNIKDDVIGPGAKLSKINTKFPLDPNEGPGVIYSPSSILSSSMDSVNGGGSVNINNVLSGAINLETSEPESASQKKGKEHPHFIVEDSLHTPRSRSNSSSPRPSVSLHTGSSGGGIEREPSIVSRLSEPTLLESVMEENVTVVPAQTQIQDIAPNLIPKRENVKNVDPRLPQDDGKLHVLFGATGCLAVFKIKGIIKKLEEIYGKENISIQVILTEAATKFFTRRFMKKHNNSMSHANGNNNSNGDVHRILSDTSITSKASSHSSPSICNGSNNTTVGGNGSTSSNTNTNCLTSIELPPHIQFWTDQDEWDAWRQRTDPVLHIELRRWADILVVAPLSANTLSKISVGLCDNLLTSVIRAWNPSYPIFLAPSMVSSTFNTMMTKKQLNIIKDEMPWITVFKPSEKVMDINGEIGLGGMMDANEIVDKIVMKLAWRISKASRGGEG